MTDLAPIALFVYNRVDHTRQTLKALSRNNLAEHSELFVFADGPKETAGSEDLKNIAAVRELIRQQTWCKKLHIIERENNNGLAANIVDGVTTVVNRFGKVIVMEDDIVTSPGFLQYMNDA